MKKLKAIVNKENRKIERKDKPLVIIEDAAQALGASWRDRKVGSIGLTGCFSFYPAKILGAYGDAGAVVTNDKKIADKIRKYRHHSYIGKNLGIENKTVEYGCNSRLDNMQAAVLNIKFKYLESSINRRSEIAQIYQNRLENVKQIVLPDTNISRVYQDYIIRVPRYRNSLKMYLDQFSFGHQELLGQHPSPRKD